MPLAVAVGEAVEEGGGREQWRHVPVTSSSSSSSSEAERESVSKNGVISLLSVLSFFIVDTEVQELPAAAAAAAARNRALILLEGEMMEYSVNRPRGRCFYVI